MSVERKKILIAMDGSSQAFDAVDYVSGNLPASHVDITLLHISATVPDAFWDWEADPLPRHVEYLREWETQREEKTRGFMEEARKMLVHAGVAENAIAVSIQKRRGGVARDVLAEAYRGGYHALVIGRKGMGGVRDGILGSVASKTVSRLGGVSVWLVGGRPKKGRVLVAVDASEGAMRAVDHLGSMLEGMPYDITLLHVVRGINVMPVGFESIFPEGYRNRLVEEAENAIKPTFEQAIQRLRALGYKPDRISTRVLTGVASRAGAIFQEATNGNYGTVVVGRRGISQTEDFDMGRVASKLTQLTKDMALWIVA